MLLTQEEGFENYTGDNQKDAGAEPRSGRFRRVGVARREFLIHFDAADQTGDGSDGIHESRQGLEIPHNHSGRFLDAVSGECRSRRGNKGQQHRDNFFNHLSVVYVFSG